MRDEHGTRIIAQRSEDNGTHRSDANQHRTFYLPFHGSIPTHGYFTRIYAYEPARDRSEIVFVVVNPMIATSDSNSQIRSCFFSIFSRNKKKKTPVKCIFTRDITIEDENRIDVIRYWCVRAWQNSSLIVQMR